ncbi:hypothetical protein ACFQ3P_42680 [Paraburkholderia sabiae]|uniref:Uncharacterized protein n=1 Tax=Paraburkholderia sabiae TaxID=273251 RepID=A0ABU9QSB6_9BURK|nr:hypothetical protein [Paraburkholderia sabiae]WJZ79503.1 hypothetical protein QEN71_39955 [Paraburkholderia sabiae]
MMLLTEEESALALADRHILEALQRISLQEERVQEAQRSGMDSSQAGELLRIMREILFTFRRHRRQLHEELERQRRLTKSFGH